MTTEASAVGELQIQKQSGITTYRMVVNDEEYFNLILVVDPKHEKGKPPREPKGSIEIETLHNVKVTITVDDSEVERRSAITIPQ